MTKNTGWIAADDVNRLIREIDVALNGVDAAPQASLCDIAAQVCKAAREFGPILGAIGAPPKPAGAHSDDWAIAAAFREVTGPNGGLIKNDEVVDFISTRAREMIANATLSGSVPLPDRDAGGRIVREAWVRWALAQSDAKPSWLVPYDDLSEADKEADRQIFEAFAAAAAARTMPEGWKITRNEVGGIHVEGPEGWMSMPDTTPKNGNFSLEMRLLYGLAEALLTAAPTPQQQVQVDGWVVADASGQCWRCWKDEGPAWTAKIENALHFARKQDAESFAKEDPDAWAIQPVPTALPAAHQVRRLQQLIGKASFAHAADKHSAMELVTRLAGQPAVAVAQDGTLIWIETLARGGLAAGSEGGRVQALKKIALVAKESAAGNNAVNVSDATSKGTDSHAVSDTTAALIDMLRKRDAVGRAKYGTTLDRTDLSQAEWLQHMAEEMLDGAGYALAAIRTLKNKGT